MKIAVIGTGGVGGYFGAKLANAGFDVTFLARGNHLKAIQNDGLKVKSILGNFEVNNLKATDKISTISNPNLILLGVKAWQIKEIRDDIKRITNSNTTIIPLQNGVMAAEELVEKIDKQNILGGLCRIISKIESPGVINHLGVIPTIVFGELDKSANPRLTEIQKVFTIAGIESKISDDIEADLWRKFIAICVSGLLAVTKTTYGELREIKGTRQMMVDLFNEIYAVSQNLNIKIESDFVEKTVSFINTFPYDSTSSLTRDVWAGKPSEIEYQNGTVVRFGEKFDVPTPINSFVYNSILPGEIKARGLNIKNFV